MNATSKSETSQSSSQKSRGQLEYEADVSFVPTYHDGTPRKRWDQLTDLQRSSWEQEAEFQQSSDFKGETK